MMHSPKRRLVVALLIVLAVLGGCDNADDSKDSVPPLPSESPTPTAATSPEPSPETEGSPYVLFEISDAVFGGPLDRIPYYNKGMIESLDQSILEQHANGHQPWLSSPVDVAFVMTKQLNGPNLTMLEESKHTKSAIETTNGSIVRTLVETEEKTFVELSAPSHGQRFLLTLEAPTGTDVQWIRRIVQVPDLNAEIIPYAPASVKVESKLEMMPVHTDNGTVYKQVQVAGGRIAITSRSADPGRLFAEFQAGDRVYDLGPIGDATYAKDEDLVIEEKRMFESNLVKISASYGANAPAYYYFRIENGSAERFLSIETGATVEQDLNGDGQPELVSSHGMPMRTIVYRLNDGKWESLNLNEILQSESVNVDEEGRIHYQQKPGDETKTASYETFYINMES